MADEAKLEKSPYGKYLAEVLHHLTDPLHKRIIKAYEPANPVQSMESELGKIIMEILDRED